MVQWVTRREAISVKIFTDNSFQGERTEFVIAKLCALQRQQCSLQLGKRLSCAVDSVLGIQT